MPTYLTIQKVPGNTKNLVLAGAERDIEIRVTGLQAALLAGYRTLKWRASIAGEPYLRIAGKYWNSTGQVGAYKSIDFNLAQNLWVLSETITLTTKFSTGIGTLDAGDYPYNVTISWQVIKPTGETAEGTEVVAGIMTVRYAQRHVPIAIDPQYPDTIVSGSFTDLVDPKCLGADSSVVLQTVTRVSTGDWFTEFNSNDLIEILVSTTKVMATENLSRGYIPAGYFPTAFPVYTESRLYLTHSLSGAYSYSLNTYIEWGSRGTPLLSSSPDFELLGGGAVDNSTTRVRLVGSNGFYGTLLSLSVWYLNGTLDSDLSIQLRDWPCVPMSTALGPEPVPPQPCLLSIAQPTVRFLKNLTFATYTSGGTGRVNANTDIEIPITVQNFGKDLVMGTPVVYTPAAPTFLTSYSLVRNSATEFIFKWRCSFGDSFNEKTVGRYEARIPITWEGDQETDCSSSIVIAVEVLENDVDCVLRVVADGTNSFEMAQGENLKVAVALEAANGLEGGSVQVISNVSWAKVVLQPNTASFGITQGGVLTIDSSGLAYGTFRGTLRYVWLNKIGADCLLDSPITLKVVREPLNPPVPPPPEVERVISPGDRRRTIEGTWFQAIPFNLRVVPGKVIVRADSKSNRYNGVLDVGLTVLPGPTQLGGVQISDMITIRAKGDRVQFVPGGKVAETPDSPLEVSLSRHFFDLKTNYIYDLTVEVKIRNKSPKKLELMVNASNLATNEPQFKANRSHPTITLASGEETRVLVCIAGAASRDSSESILVAIESSQSGVVGYRDTIQITSSENGKLETPYLIANSSQLTIPLGSTQDFQLMTSNGPSGLPERWMVSNPAVLLSRGIIVTSGGRVRSNLVTGTVSSLQTVVSVHRETRPGSYIFAAKAIQLNFTT